MYGNDGRKWTVLIADDAMTNRVLLTRILNTEYNIVEAIDGLAALEKMRVTPNLAAVLLDIVMPELDGFGVLAQMQEDEALRDIPVVVVTASNEEETQIRALRNGAVDVITKPFNPQIIYHRIKNIITRMEANRLSEENRAYAMELRLLELDEKTGLYNKRAFITHTERLLRENPDKKYVIVRWDIDNFKVYNEIFGTDVGDRYLRLVGEYYIRHAEEIPGLAIYARYDAEHFVCCREEEGFDPEALIKKIADALAGDSELNFEYTPRMGIYRIHNISVDVALMCDRALMALRSIKNHYDRRYAWYDDEMRLHMLDEQRIVNEMETALKDGQFVPYLQPQYNCDTGALVGAEVLVRWLHPEKGLVPPIKFLPLFERNGFISKLDVYIWERAFELISAWKEAGVRPVPISLNLSRRDIYNLPLADVFGSFLQKYCVEPSLVNLEITETAYTQNSEQLINAVNELRRMGMQVHMDDFGSGYSSLNMLKSVPVDLLKLDMRFLDKECGDDRGDSILSAVMRMADALSLPVLAEGVETKEQADTLKSIGCFLMQGYFFARPMPVSDFDKLLREKAEVRHEAAALNASSQSALLYNGIIGGAALVEYNKADGTLAVMRINDQYLKEINMTRAEYIARGADMLCSGESPHRDRIIAMLDKALLTGEETSCEVLTSGGAEQIWLRLHARLMVKNAGRDIFCLAIENINESKLLALRNEELVEQLRSILRERV